ncbi:sensor histidine kinase [Nocardioides sp.]|uniref:sensor histidine kinase n=1 Tax=Nocardioides sp. TaxID=35761 RepID=UPI00262D3B1E|nr:sensor histidine kinase [Nocardioides sp.]
MSLLRNPVAQFLAAGFVTLVLVILVTSRLSRDAADDEAIKDAQALTRVLAQSVAEPAIPPGLVSGDAAAIDQLDRRVLDKLLVEDVLRIKIWDEDGTVLYSDQTELVASSYPLGDDELEILDDGGIDAEISDADRPENRFESDLGGVLEVYTRIESPEGQPLLFEAYYSAAEIEAQRAQVLDRFRPITVGALLALVLITTPLMLLLTRRVARSGQEREVLLQSAIQASDAERVRIARDLHDGVVQDLAGSSYALSTISSRAGVDAPMADELEEVSRSLRASMRALRSLLVEIYPPDLHTEGLAAALTDLVAPVVSTGTQVDLDVTGEDEASETAVALVWRVAQEAVRNVARHARAERMSVTVRREADHLILEVVDDGTGFDPAAAQSAGHLGLRGLNSLVRDAGGTLVVTSTPGSGATVRLEVPAS